MIVLLRDFRCNSRTSEMLNVKSVSNISGGNMWQIESKDGIYRISHDDLIGVFDDVFSYGEFMESHEIVVHRFFEPKNRDMERKRYMQGLGIPDAAIDRVHEYCAAKDVVVKFDREFGR